MRLEMYTTKNALVYQRDKDEPVIMYGAAAGCGVAFDDEHMTSVRASSTRSRFVKTISIGQPAIGMRNITLPVGATIVLDGTIIASNIAWQAFPFCWEEALYQHQLRFEKASQVIKALHLLSQTNIVVTEVNMHPDRCKSLSFQTPYALGPVMRAVLVQKMRPESSLFNRNPDGRKASIFADVTFGKIAFILAAFILAAGAIWINLQTSYAMYAAIPSQNDAWCDIVFCLCGLGFMIWLSRDVLGLCEVARVRGRSQRKQVEA